MSRVVVLAVLAAGCEEDVPHDCDNGTPTCESNLVVKLPDPRTTFTIRIRDDVEFDATIECPGTDPADGVDAEPGYHYACGGGRITLWTNLSFETHFWVQLEQGQEQEFTDQHENLQFGTDFCGNECSSITVQLD
jgi:hypothetical protein